MARVALTNDQVARIIQASKALREDVRGTSKGGDRWVASKLEVENQIKVTLHIHANADLVDRSKYSFSLILSSSYRIASFDAGSSHANRHTDSNKWLGQPHKHRWNELCRDSYAYTPTDIDETSLETAFRSFCKELAVDFQGNIEELPAIQQTIHF
jgi:hypothetical protein